MARWSKSIFSASSFQRRVSSHVACSIAFDISSSLVVRTLSLCCDDLLNCCLHRCCYHRQNRYFRGSRASQLFCLRLCCSSKLKSLARYFMFGPSVRSTEPTMPSADFCNSIPSPLSDGGHFGKVADLPRVMRPHLHAYARRIYSQALRTGFGL
jgi:hypothetical protein